MFRLRGRKEQHQPDFQNLQFVVLTGTGTNHIEKHNDTQQQEEHQRHRKLKITKPSKYLSWKEPRPMEKAFLAGSTVQKVRGADECDLMRIKKKREPENPPRTAAEILQDVSSKTAFIEVVSTDAQGFEGVPFSELDPEQYVDDDKTTKGLLLQWLRTIEMQQHSFTSPIIWADCIFTQIQRATSKLPQPNLFRSASASLLLAKICNELVSNKTPATANPLENILSRLLSEVYASIFQGWEECISPLKKLKEGNLDQAFCNLALHATSTSRVEQELAAYRKDVEVINSEADAERKRKTTVMLAEVRIWKKHLLSRLFKAWKNESRNASKARSAVSMIINRLSSRIRHFVSWVAFLLLRLNAGECKWDRETQNQNNCKRDWRLKQTTLQLDVSKLKTELVRGNKTHAYQIEDITRQQDTKIKQLSARIKQLEEQVSNQQTAAEGMTIQLKEMTHDRDRWTVLCNEILHNMTGEINDREHPHFALLTDKCKRRREINTLSDCITTLKTLDPNRNNERQLSRATQQLEVLKEIDYEYLSADTKISDILSKNKSSEHIVLCFCNYILDKEGIYRFV